VAAHGIKSSLLKDDWIKPAETGRAIPGCRSLVYIVIEQKISLSSAKAVMQRVDALCPVWSANALLAVPAEELRAAGLATRKVEYCHGIAQAV